MSFRDGSATPDAYSAPLPPRRRSPWLYVGLGCGLLTLLTVGGVIAASYMFVNKIKSEIAKPIDKTAVIKSLGDLPVYPGAQFNENMTKAQRATFAAMAKVMPTTSISAAAFETPDKSDKVFDWYDTKLTSLGYSSYDGGNMTGLGSDKYAQQQYKKGDDLALVQVQRHPQAEGKNLLVLIRFVGFKGK